MSGVDQIPTDYKKFIDQTFYAYVPKVKVLRTVFSEQDVDSGEVNLEYAKLLQTYAEATGHQGMDAPDLLADGAAPLQSSMGTESVISTISTYGEGFTIFRKLMNSGISFQKEFVARHSLEVLNSIENKVNTTLNTNMASNAGQSYSATATWATTGDPVADVIDAKTTFRKGVGGTMDADFLLLHPDNYASIAKDQRFQSSLYASKSLETGVITPKPFGLDVLQDTAVTKGSFFLGKKGMFGKLMVTENFKVIEHDLGVIGKRFDAVFSFVDQYPLPSYLLYGTGI